MDAQNRELAFRQVDREVVGIFRNLEREFADLIGVRPVADNALGFQADGSV